ncbi:scaffold protein CheW associated with MCPs of class 34H, partial [Candidatus Magnetoovum chiemensis]
PSSIEAAPRLGTNLNTAFIKGMGKRDDTFIIILDIDKIFSLEELAMVKEGLDGEGASAETE